MQLSNTLKKRINSAIGKTFLKHGRDVRKWYKNCYVGILDIYKLTQEEVLIATHFG